MNLFVIPSWYPSPSNPSYGIFVKEQVQLMGDLRQDWSIGVSTWGQGDVRKQLWVRDFLLNGSKIVAHLNDSPQHHSQGNIHTYYQPTLSWTKRFMRGNLQQIVKSNEVNFLHAVEYYGKPDIISVQASYPGIFGADHLSKKYGVPVHVHLRLGGSMFENLLRDVGSMQKAMLKAINSAAVRTVTSDFQRRSLEQYVHEVNILPNPVNCEFFREVQRAGDNVLAVGRLEREKGFDLLIHAVKQLDWCTLTIIGSGSEFDYLQKLITKLELNSRVSLLGEQDKMVIKSEVAKSSFLVLPSRYETFGNVLLEAMASGKPVVATKCGGPEEIVSSKTGILCEPSIEGLMSGMNEMKSRRDTFTSSDIRKETVLRFSPESWINKLESLFKSIL